MTQAKPSARKAAISLIAQHWPEAKLGKVSTEDLIWLLDIIDLLEGGGKRNMAETLNHYRAAYEDTAAYSGRLSKNNGDEIAKILGGLEPKAVIRAAEVLLDLEKGELWAKYERLNPGQQRMNAGNRIRAGVKRGDFGPKELNKALKVA